jgi:hypothetical protein
MKASRVGFDLKQHIPWQVKIVAKIILARLPLSYGFWEWLSLFKHGEMERPEYAFQVFCRHFERVQFPRKTGGFVGLELGPGDSLFSALIAKALGASKVYLVDVGAFARTDLTSYRKMASYLSEQGLRGAGFGNCRTTEEFLMVCSADYLTAGLASLNELPTAAVDFIWS